MKEREEYLCPWNEKKLELLEVSTSIIEYMNTRNFDTVVKSAHLHTHVILNNYLMALHLESKHGIDTAS